MSVPCLNEMGDFFCCFKSLLYLSPMNQKWNKTKKVEFMLNSMEKHQSVTAELKKMSWTPREFSLLLPRLTHSEIDYMYEKIFKKLV